MKIRHAILVGLCAAALPPLAPTALAQASAQTASASSSTAPAQAVSIVGSRRLRDSAVDTMVPVDVIPLSRSAEQGGTFDLAQTLQFASPSFNSTRQTGADGADLIDSASLRGLGSDQTLVLVNGKRRHTVALVNLFGARNRGNTGTDMNAIPLLAVEQVQVLRDGAAAQYGSDAIAGVINIDLKTRAGCESILGWSQYSAGDGRNLLGSAYCGYRLDGGGQVSVTGEWLDRGRSNRAEPGNPRIIGDTASRNGTLYLNGSMPLSDAHTKAYFTLGMQRRDASSAAFARGGVGSDDIPSRNSAAMYPQGFVPFINGDVDDRHLIVGVRTRMAGWQADVSQTYGYNRLDYRISNTLNASIANLDLTRGGKGISPREFKAGGFSFGQLTTNADLSRFFPELMGGTNVALGAEHRQETYRIFAGEAGSYIDADGLGEGGNPGSQGFPGFQPSDVTNSRRHSQALYLDLETEPSPDVKVGAAVRGERYSDFGSTVTGKLAGSLRLSPAALLRGSASTGFRAPSLQQVRFSSTFTDFISGQPLDVVLAPNGSAVANAAGIPKLKEEKSESLTLGMTLKPSASTSVTADVYRIDIRDRIVLSGRFDEGNFPALASNLAALGVGQAQFFVNSVATRTTGLDLTASHRTALQGATLGSFVALNLSRTRVQRINTPASLKGFEDVLLSERERLFLEEGAPRRKAIVGLDYTTGPWNVDLKVIHFGAQTLGTFSGTAAGVPNQVYKPKTSADIAVSHAFSPATKLTVGATNVFNVKPTAQDPNETDNGFKYESVQFGLSGAAYFMRLWHRF